MIRTVVAFESSATRDAVAEMLEKNGIEVRHRCRTFNEAVRAVNIMGGGVIICGYKSGDTTAEQLAYDLEEQAYCLVIAKQHLLDMCTNDKVFKLPLPITPAEFIGSVNILLQLDNMRAQKDIAPKSASDKEVVSKAKQLLMEKFFMSEQESHRYLQRKSMENSVKIDLIAAEICEKYNK